MAGLLLLLHLPPATIAGPRAQECGVW
uniref:Uncharacterized protein n=1 Tax=Arundo donax TaxID=35708 RepID=A0A0A9A3R4_ARUDO